MAVLDAVPRQGGPQYVLRRNQSNGLWLRIEARDEQLAEDIAAGLNLTAAQRIVLPFQVVAIPPGSTVTASSVGFLEGAFVDGGVMVTGATGATMEVQAQWAGRGPGAKESNHLSQGRQAYLYPGQDEVELTGIQDLYLSARIGKGYRGFKVSDADLVLGSLVIAADAGDMSTWPPTITAVR